MAREVYTDIQQLAKAHKWLWIVVALRYGNKGNIFLQLVSQHRCIASWNPLLHALPRLWPTCHEAKYSASLRNFTHIIGQSCVIKAGFLKLALRLLAVIFFLNFPCQWSSLSITQYEAQFNIWQLGEKLYFCDSSSNPFSFFFLATCLKGQRGYDSPPGLCTGKIYDLNFRELLVYFEFSLSSQSAIFFLFALLLGFARANPKRWISLFQAFSYSGRSIENSARKRFFIFFARCFLRCALTNWTPGRG